ncbi:MAG: sulfurtransferase [Pseudomonadota bacterium]
MKNDAVVEPAWLAENLDNPSVRIVEVSDMKNPEAYLEGHIPGAINWPWMESLWHPTDREIVPAEGFAALMERSGIGHGTTIVIYSNQFQYACYAFRVCIFRGHSRVKILNGKRDVWINENLPMTRKIPEVAPSTYPVRPSDESSRIRWQEIVEGLDKPDRVVLDLRTPEEYLGERVSPPWFEYDHGAVRKGHIPGAKHLFYEELLNEDESLKPLDQIRESYARRGATPDKEIITYCRLSHRGSMGWFVATYLLGYPRARVYDGSWTEWGSLVGVPIVRESQKEDSAPSKGSGMGGCG